MTHVERLRSCREINAKFMGTPYFRDPLPLCL